MRVDGWYRSGNPAPEPELSRWRLNSTEMLQDLAHELSAGSWTPTPWVQLPYPKDAVSLRHYVRPPVKDQVAFMAHLVLLGPLIDHAIPRFVFGNRWYRRVVWRRRGSPPRWHLLPYPLLTAKTFLPYSRDYGLFRRTAHWTVAQMTGADAFEADYRDHAHHPDVYEESALPPWVQKSWWPESTNPRASWAALDLQLAYPSIHHHQLGTTLHDMLADVEESTLRELVTGYPRPVLATLADHAARAVICDRLVHALGEVRLDPTPIRSDSWSSAHARPILPPSKDIGLPTGLAVSGILFNAALNKADCALLAQVSASKGEKRSAIVRFADDYYLLSRSTLGLFSLIEAVWRAVGDELEGSLSKRECRSNLYINLHKIRPSPIQNVVMKFLHSQGWKPCDTCGELLPCDEPSTAENLTSWWRETQDYNQAQGDREDILRATLSDRDLGPFVTALVERLSQIGTDTLEARFGGRCEGASNTATRVGKIRHRRRTSAFGHSPNVCCKSSSWSLAPAKSGFYPRTRECTQVHSLCSAQASLEVPSLGCRSSCGSS